jgi:hypothetical protein
MSSFTEGSAIVDYDEVPAILKVQSCTVPDIAAAVDFLLCFRSTTNDPSTLELVRSLTDTRAVMKEMLHDSKANGPPTRTIQAIDNYLPHLFRLMTSLNNQDPVPLDKALSFVWSSAVDHSEYNFGELVFELSMALYAKAVMHQREAVRLLDVDRMGNLSAAGQQFLTAAGVMDYLGAVLLPKWFPTPGVVNRRPVESSPTWCLGLAAWFEASAQSCAIVKALTKGGTEVLPPYPILSKLCTGVVEKCRIAFDTIEAPVLSFVGNPFTDYIGFMREVNIALANYYNAEVQYHSAECGQAMSYYRKALVRTR